MSSGEAIPRDKALKVYNEFMKMLDNPKGKIVKRYEYAGSLRRRKKEVHDIEIVAIPKFEELQSTLDYFDDHDKKHVITVNKLHGKMEQLLAEGIINTDRPRNDRKRNPFGDRYYRINFVTEEGVYPIDLFAVLPPADYNVILLIRTGSAEFSKWFVQQGQPYGISVKDGHLEKDRKPIYTYSEMDVFDKMHVEYCFPSER